MMYQYVDQTQKLQRNSVHSSLPHFKKGQVVMGTVEKHISRGLVRTRILNHPFIASTKLSVSVGDNLLLHVTESQPKPHLQVISSKYSDKGHEEQLSGRIQTISQLLKTGFPLSLDSLKNGLFTNGFTTNELSKLVAKHPEFWRKIFWNLTPASHADIQKIQKWYEVGHSLFSNSIVENIHVSGLQNNFQYSASQAEIAISHLQLFNPINDGVSHLGQLLNAQSANMHFMNSLQWDYGNWIGLFFPFVLHENAGIMAVSYWQPYSELNLPKRLSMIAAFNNGWIIHLNFDYRKTDLAGLIEVNSNNCEKAVNQHLTHLLSDLEHKGFNHTGIRVRKTEKLTVEFSRLLPPVKRTETYAG